MADDKQTDAPDHKSLNLELNAELLDLRAKVLTLTRNRDEALEIANSKSAEASDALRELEKVRRDLHQLQINHQAALDAQTPLNNKIRDLETKMRDVIDTGVRQFEILSQKYLALRP